MSCEACRPNRSWTVRVVGKSADLKRQDSEFACHLCVDAVMASIGASYPDVKAYAVQEGQ